MTKLKETLEKLNNNWVYIFLFLIFSGVATLVKLKKNIDYLNPNFEKEVKSCDKLVAILENKLDQFEVPPTKTTNSSFLKRKNEVEFISNTFSNISKINCMTDEFLIHQEHRVEGFMMLHSLHLIESLKMKTNTNDFDELHVLTIKHLKVYLNYIKSQIEPDVKKNQLLEETIKILDDEK